MYAVQLRLARIGWISLSWILLGSLPRDSDLSGLFLSFRLSFRQPPQPLYPTATQPWRRRRRRAWRSARRLVISSESVRRRRRPHRRAARPAMPSGGGRSPAAAARAPNPAPAHAICKPMVEEEFRRHRERRQKYVHACIIQLDRSHSHLTIAFAFLPIRLLL